MNEASMEYHLAIPTKYLESRPLPLVCVASGTPEGVSYYSLVLRERLPALISMIYFPMGGAGDTLRVNVPLSRWPATVLRWQPLVYVCSMFIVAGLSSMAAVGLQDALPNGGSVAVGMAIAVAGFIAYRSWRWSITPVALVDYDARVTVLAVKRADVAAAIERHVADLLVSADLRSELRASQARLHRARGTRSSLPEEDHRGALTAPTSSGGDLTEATSIGALSTAGPDVPHEGRRS
jgi:hypothetical protein